MIVDDNRVNVRILHRALQIGLKSVNIDLEVLTAEGGDAAIALYKDAHPSLCIIDYHMPETDGIASTRAIRAYEKEQGIVASHILCYTADVSDETKKLLLRSGFDNVISKPPYKGFIAELVGRLELYHTKEDISSIEDMADEKDSA
jgi:CheY-like chemotaxis protein